MPNTTRSVDARRRAAPVIIGRVGCPVCGAARGDPCRSLTDRPLDIPHEPRGQDAADANTPHRHWYPR